MLTRQATFMPDDPPIHRFMPRDRALFYGLWVVLFVLLGVLAFVLSGWLANKIARPR